MSLSYGPKIRFFHYNPVKWKWLLLSIYLTYSYIVSIIEKVHEDLDPLTIMTVTYFFQGQSGEDLIILVLQVVAMM